MCSGKQVDTRFPHTLQHVRLELPQVYAATGTVAVCEGREGEEVTGSGTSVDARPGWGKKLGLDTPPHALLDVFLHFRVLKVFK